MARYIDAEKQEKDGWWATRNYQQDAKTNVYETKKMTDFPTADVVEKERYDILLEHANILAEEMRKYQNAHVPERNVGKWKQGCCSECGYDWGKDAPIASVPNFCPNCGAKMNGKETEDAEIHNR